jgi:hypothetical protein
MGSIRSTLVDRRACGWLTLAAMIAVTVLAACGAGSDTTDTTEGPDGTTIASVEGSSTASDVGRESTVATQDSTTSTTSPTTSTEEATTTTAEAASETSPPPEATDTTTTGEVDSTDTTTP